MSSAVFEARVAPDGDSAVVSISYSLLPPRSRTGSVAPIPFTLLGVGEATAYHAVLDGEETIVLWPTSGSRRAAMVPSGVVHGDTLDLHFSYVVRRAVEVNGKDVTVRLPVLAGPAPRGGGEGDAFQIEVSLPLDWTFRDGFPSLLRPDAAGGVTGSLSVTPSVVSLRARTGGDRGVPLPILVDGVTIALIGLLSLFGWWRLTRGASTPRAT